MNCDSNQRCEACPIERLPGAEDRVKAGDVVRSVSRILSSSTDNGASALKFRNLHFVATEKAKDMQAEELTPYILGAAAIVAAGECKLD